MNAQHQAEEVEALKAIYEDDFRVVSHKENSYIVKIRSNDHLISLELMLIFPEDYPSHSPPVYEIRSAAWIDGQQLECINKQLTHLFNENGGEVVVYQWVEWLREFVSEKAEEIQLPVPEPSESESKREDDVTNSYGGEPELGEYKAQAANSELLTPSMTVPTIVHGEPLTDRKSTFQAHVAQVTTTEEVKAVVLELKQNKKIATATHNILAYRLYNSSTNTYQQDCDDDGEAAAGGRLLHLLQIMDVRDVIVVVTRWRRRSTQLVQIQINCVFPVFVQQPTGLSHDILETYKYGGIHLHADRFKHINNVARTLIQDTGLGLKHKDTHKDGKNSKAKTVSKSKSGRHR